MLSILIPSYNHSRFVVEAIASARRINAPGKHIYVIDDASSDESAEVIENYLKLAGSEDVTFIRKPLNKGAIDSVLTFLSLCQTEYVYFMASDDIVIPNGVEALLQCLEASPDLAFTIGGGMNVFPDGSNSPIYSAKHDAFFDLDAKLLVRATFLNCPSPILCQSSVFRLSAIREVGGFDPSMIADDYALFTRLFQHFNRRWVDFEFLPHVDCIRYRHHEINSYRNLPRQALATCQVIHGLAPAELRYRAAGDKLAFYSLIALRNMDLSSLRSLIGMLKLPELPWFAAGLVTNILTYIRQR
jgi:glycosyltransferase involved in cell wall biosynthesis